MSVLEVDSLHKRFGAQQAISGVSFRVEVGQVFGLLGPNGSGKTTTIACALGLLRPDAGSSEVLGYPAHQLARSQGKLGAVFDQDNLIEGLSVLGNLEYARRLLGHRGGRTPGEALSITGIAELAKRRAGKLSLGQRKRVAVARALLGSPQLLVLDEPLSALDPRGVKDTLVLIRSLAAEGLSVVLSSHRLHEMQEVISHALVLDRGRCVAQGSLEELISAGERRYQLELLEVPDPEATLSWLRSRFEGLRCERLGAAPGVAGPLAGAARYQLSGSLAEDFGASLTAALTEAGLKLNALVPSTHNLESFFEEIVEREGGQA